MAEKEKYIINIQGELVGVSPDIYQLYFRMERQERTLEEKVQRHEVSYDALDNGETVGVDAFPDDAPSPEEQAITQEIYDRLHRAIDALPKAERELIKSLYFEGMTEQEYAKAKKMRQSTVSYRRLRTLSKMKKFCCFLGSF